MRKIIYLFVVLFLSSGAIAQDYKPFLCNYFVSSTLAYDNCQGANSWYKIYFPDTYTSKKELEEKINYCIEDMAYKPPELLSQYFTFYCNMIIPFLPKDKKNNQWVIQPWENIHKVAQENIKNFKKISGSS